MSTVGEPGAYFMNKTSEPAVETADGTQRKPELRQREPRSASGLLLRRSWIVVLGAVAIGIVTYLVSREVTATYSSSATVAIQVSGTDADATSLGANNLAAQFAQQVGATQVLRRAQRSVGAAIPSTSITGGTVGAQNIIAINAVANTPDVAQRRAQAVTNAFVTYVSGRVASQSRSYEHAASHGISPLTRTIRSVQSQLSQTSATSARAAALEGQLTTLIAERATAQADVAQTAVSGTPTVAIVSDAGAGSQTAPKPKLYAVIGFVIGLLALARLVVVVSPGPRRRDVAAQ
jgi:uncharacterized protein involved in exopolysaccharide biosynthesis